MPHANFVHLHCHTQYSLLNSSARIDELISRAVELKFSALAMTDNGNLFGTIPFYQHALKKGIKPIIGLDAYVAPGSRFEKQTHGIKEASFRLNLLARNEEGYKNLMKLSSAGYLEGFYYRPRIDKEILKQHSEGLIALSGSLKGEIPYCILNDRMDEARRAVEEYLDIFGKENFYFEIMDHGVGPEKKLIETYAEFSKTYGIDLVATNDVHYVNRQDAQAHDVLICIGTGAAVEDQNRLRFHGDQYYLKSEQEMRTLFKKYPEAVENTVKIAERCNVELNFDKTYLPRFEPPQGKKLENYVKELCVERLNFLFDSHIPQNYQERLDYELSVIQKMGYISYFLIVWDFIRYAKDKDIPVGPGRGSAAGSLVAYALEITNVDPIKHGLIFERFLNPDRVSMPDIDIDFCYERREEVIDYVRRKYGTDNVAQIITFGTMAAKAVIRDVGRVLALSYQEVDKLAKLIPMELNITIKLAMQKEPKLKELAATDARVDQLLKISQSLEGLSRHASTHAAGVVISDVPLTEHVPLFKADEQVSTQFTMKDLEKIGLLKMDFLGLKTLTMIVNTMKIVEKQSGLKIDLNALTLDDQKTYEMLSRAEAIGVFQLESSGMRDLLKKMKPTLFDHLVALLALYRPGPLGSGMVDDFIRRMHNPKLIQYDHPLLEPVLNETYGIILYQEQVMKIVSEMAGFTLAQADSLRRAIGKKIPEVMDRERKSFLDGAGKKDVELKIAEHVWNLIDYFSGYGFNKSHSTAYALISYHTAYLKAHHPLEFMTALLTSEMGNTNKVVRYIEEAKKMGIEVYPPSVNQSSSEFTCADNHIRFGLAAIKNVGLTAIDAILESRSNEGSFKNLIDFVKRVDLRVCNRKVVESLIKCGAFDDFGATRAQLMTVLDQALEMGASFQKDQSRGQMSFFGGGDQTSSFQDEGIDMPEIPEWPENQLLAYERELMGFYVTSHPLSKHTKTLKNYATASTDTLIELNDQAEVTLGGIVDQFKEIITKKGDKMAFVTLQDLRGSCEVVVFPSIYESSSALLKNDAIVFVRGKINARDDNPKVLADEIVPLEEVPKRFTRLVSIDLQTAGLEPSLLEDIRKILAAYKGRTPVYLSFRDPQGKVAVIDSGDDMRVEASDQLLESLEKLVGENSVKIK
ncbi:MAG: DNA polymerase III subunit alpha [Candidatus Omnitrophica bacterium]|nr:DNA polymerase III subunit alpha [Candidatus Omnitrophota bacterium]